MHRAGTVLATAPRCVAASMSSVLCVSVARSVGPSLAAAVPTRALSFCAPSVPAQSVFRATTPLAGPKKKGGPAAAAPTETFDLSKVVPVNIVKNKPDPEYKDESEYPTWLFDLLEPQPTLNDYSMQGLGNLEAKHLKRALRLFNRQRVKLANEETHKG